MNKHLGSRSLYTQLLVLFTLLLFLLWFSKGFFIHIGTDVMKEAIGGQVLLKFPQNMFVKTHFTGTGTWFNSRWTNSLFSFMGFQVVAPIASFFTGNPVKSLFIGQGVYISIVFTGISWILSLYVACALNIRVASKRFLLILLFSSSTFVLADILFFFGPSVKIFFLSLYLPAFWTAYIACYGVMLLALYPYWRYYIKGKWDDWYQNNTLRTLWFLLIILTAFSTNGITFIYGIANGLLWLYFCYSERKIISLHHKFGEGIYTSLFWSFLSLLFESINRPGSFIPDGLLDSLVTCIIYLGFYAAVCGVPLLHAFHKKQSIKFYGIIFFCYIMTVIFLLSVGIAGKSVLSSTVRYYCANIPLYIAATFSWAYFFFNNSSAFIRSFILMFILSHFIFFINYYPNKSGFDKSYEFISQIYQKNIESREGERVVYADFDISSPDREYWGAQFFIDMMQEFFRQTGIIDKDVILKETAINNEKEGNRK